MKLTTLTIACLCVIGGLAWGQGSGSPPATQRSEVRRPKHSAPALERPADGGEIETRATLWKEVGDFMGENSPARWKEITKLAPEQQKKFADVLIQRYRSIQWAKRDPEMYALKKKEVHLEDDIWVLGRQVRSGPAGSAATEATKTELRAKVKELIDTRLKEREERINRLRAMLEQENDSIAKAKANQEQAAEDELQAAISGTTPDHVRRPDGKRPRDREDRKP